MDDECIYDVVVIGGALAGELPPRCCSGKIREFAS